MKYDDIMKIKDIHEKNKSLKDFYLNEINILSWLDNTNNIQKILFKDRFEIKKNGLYHNLTGPAIKWRNGVEDYWIHGTY